MQNFYQGSMRCKDFIPFLKTTLEEHDWLIADYEDSASAQWFVAQKVATSGDIMTVAVRDNYFPNFGALVIVPVLAIDNSVNGDGVYTSAYDPVTKALLHVYCQTSNYSSSTTSRVIDPIVSYGLPVTCAYYTAGKEDSETNPTHLFYVVCFSDDGFFVKVRGNPAVANYTSRHVYIGTYDKIFAEQETNDAKGLWGSVGSNTTMLVSRLSATAPTSTNWESASATSLLSSASVRGDMHPTPSFEGQYVFPIGMIEEGRNYPFFTLPSSFLLGTTRGGDHIDENIFVDANGDKFIYCDSVFNSQMGLLIKAVSGIKELSVADTGAGYEVTWQNPNSSEFKKCALYAKLIDYPTGHDDPDAVLVYENNAAVKGDIETFVDSDPARYGQTVYYAAVAFDDGLPEPNASLITTTSKQKTSPVLISMDTLPYKFNAGNLDYVSTNESALAPYYSPVAVYHCDDNDASTMVFESVSAIHGAASVTTDTMSVVDGTYGNAFDLSGNKRIVIPADSRLQFSNSFSFCARVQAPSVYATNHTLFSTNSNDWLMYKHNASNPAACYFHWQIQGSGANFPIPYQLDNAAPHFIWMVKKGQNVNMYMDGELLPIGTNCRGAARIWNNSLVETYLGSRVSADYWNGIMNEARFYAYPVSAIQIKNDHNKALPFNTTDIVDGMAVIAKQGVSVGERIVSRLPEEIDFAGVNTLNIDCYASRAGEIFKLVFINKHGAEFSENVTINSAQTWETKAVNIASVDNSIKRNIVKVAIAPLDDSSDTIISFKNVVKA